MESYWSVLALISWAIEVLFIVIADVCIFKCFPVLSYSSFNVSDLTLRSLIHFELIFV
jgi:hypothetical protein